jgi:hypothetical protein
MDSLIHRSSLGAGIVGSRADDRPKPGRRLDASKGFLDEVDRRDVSRPDTRSEGRKGLPIGSCYH